MKRYTFTRHLAHRPMRSAVERALRVPDEKRTKFDEQIIGLAIAWRKIFDKWQAAVTKRKAA